MCVIHNAKAWVSIVLSSVHTVVVVRLLFVGFAVIGGDVSVIIQHSESSTADADFYGLVSSACTTPTLPFPSRRLSFSLHKKIFPDVLRKVLYFSSSVCVSFTSHARGGVLFEDWLVVML